MQTLDLVHTAIAIATSLVMFMVVWWKVSKENELNRIAIKGHDQAIADLKANKTDVAVTEKLITVVEKIEHDLITHHTDFKMHRTEDSERRMSDLVDAVNEMARENRADHQVIMNKLGRVERLDDREEK